MSSLFSLLLFFVNPSTSASYTLSLHDALPISAGGCVEDTIAGLRITYSGLASRFPNFQLIIPHLGGTIPFLRSEEHTSELQSRGHLVCRLLLEKKKASPRPCWGSRRVG